MTGERMLHSIEINGFRSCDSVVLDDLDYLVALVGRNGAGKSNILRAIYWAATQASVPRSSDARALASIRNARVALTFTTVNSSLRYELAATSNGGSPLVTTVAERLWLENSGSQQLVAERSGQEITIIEGTRTTGVVTDSSTPMLLALSERESSLSPIFSQALSFLSSVHYYPLNELNAYGDSNDVSVIPAKALVEWLRTRSPDRLASNNAELRILSMSLFDKDKYEDFMSIVGPDGLGLLDSIQISGTGTTQDNEALLTSGEPLNLFYYIFYLKDTKHFFYPQLSYGTRRVIDIVAALVYDQSSVMLIEHPEDGIHIGLLRKLLGVIYSFRSTTQVFAATHSRTLLNDVKFKQIRFVSSHNGITSAAKLAGEKLEVAEKYITGHGDDSGSVYDFIELREDDSP